MMEYLTRWAVTVALDQADSESIATAMLFEIVLKFEPPKKLITDSELSITSVVMQVLAQRLQLRHATNSVEHFRQVAL
jgi:hypothetical protein